MKLITSKSLLKLRKFNLRNLDISFLSDDERRVLEMRLDGKSLDEIGNILGVTSQRIWQLEAKACNRIIANKRTKKRAKKAIAKLEKEQIPV